MVKIESICFAGQMFLLDRFFDGTFLTFGIEVLSFADRDQEDRIDPMVYIFPRYTIEISLDRIPLQASTCAPIYDRQRPHLYYGGEYLKYYSTPSPADFLARRAALRTNSIDQQPSYKWKGGGGQSTT
jgi:hypothetical protein